MPTGARCDLSLGTGARCRGVRPSGSSPCPLARPAGRQPREHRAGLGRQPAGRRVACRNHPLPSAAASTHTHAIPSLRSPPLLRRQDEVFELLHWLRQAMGLAGGVLWGYLDLPGLIGFLGCGAWQCMAAHGNTEARMAVSHRAACDSGVGASRGRRAGASSHASQQSAACPRRALAASWPSTWAWCGGSSAKCWGARAGERERAKGRERMRPAHPSSRRAGACRARCSPPAAHQPARPRPRAPHEARSAPPPPQNPPFPEQHRQRRVGGEHLYGDHAGGHAHEHVCIHGHVGARVQRFPRVTGGSVTRLSDKHARRVFPRTASSRCLQAPRLQHAAACPGPQ